MGLLPKKKSYTNSLDEKAELQRRSHSASLANMQIIKLAFKLNFMAN